MTRSSIVPAWGDRSPGASKIRRAWRGITGGVIVGMGMTLLVGCSRNPEPTIPEAKPLPAAAAPANPGMAASPLDSTNVIRTFSARGVIRELKASEHALVIRHEAVPGFMPKMTMEFSVRDTNGLRGLSVGDTVTFQVRANEQESWVEAIRRVEAGAPVPTPAPSDPATASLIHAGQLKPGDLFPDAELLSEDGRPVKFSDFRGTALAFTLIFTRCPLPDYCPRMNQQFRQARELLLQRAGTPTNWQFLSISFDPEFDTPEVLRNHARRYRHDNPDRWLFAAAPLKVLATLAPELNLMFAKEASGSISHNLRTIVLDPQGRLHKQFDGNQWTPAALAEALLAAAQVK